MAQMDRFYIGQLNGKGLQTNLKPYAIPDDAFAELNNAYVFRGRVRKRFGSRLMVSTANQIAGLEQIQSRFKINIGTTSGGGGLSGTIPGAVQGIGIAFSVGSSFFTVYQTGTPAATLVVGTGSATYNTSTGAFVITGAPATTVVYYYPATPVMGLATFQDLAGPYEDIVGFDTQFAYQFGANGWDILGPVPPASGSALFTGSNYQYFWTCSARGPTGAETYLYVTNYNTSNTGTTGSDRMMYWDGTNWNNFSPSFDSTTPGQNIILSAKIIIYFKSRLLLLNVVENTGAGAGTNATYVNRCRYSWTLDPTDVAAFYDNVAGHGSGLDAPTKESIISAQFLKDRLIVFFDSSTWELAYTGNQVNPFVWQQINTELGAISTFSEVPFDKVVLGIGTTGIHACNGSNVDRIDEIIPDSVFQIHNVDNGNARVFGIRDYYTEMVYWSFPSESATSTDPFNSRILTYNYKNGAWAFNNDSITVFGYFQQTSAGSGISSTWANSIMTWQESNDTWGSATLQAKFRNVVAGNQQGYVFIIDPDVSINSPSLQISNMTYNSEVNATMTVVNHNLSVGDYVKINEAQGVTSLNGLIRQVYAITDQNTVVLATIGDTITGTYTGGGILSKVTPIDFKTKQYNFYDQEGRNAYIPKVDFFVDKTTNGQCTVDFYISSSDYGMIAQAQATGAITGDSVLETSPYALSSFEQQQERLWHPVYFYGEGETVQFRFYLSNDQATNTDIAESDFQLHAMIINAEPTSARI